MIRKTTRQKKIQSFLKLADKKLSQKEIRDITGISERTQRRWKKNPPKQSRKFDDTIDSFLRNKNIITKARSRESFKERFAQGTDRTTRFKTGKSHIATTKEYKSIRLNINNTAANIKVNIELIIATIESKLDYDYRFVNFVLNFAADLNNYFSMSTGAFDINNLDDLGDDIIGLLNNNAVNKDKYGFNTLTLLNIDINMWRFAKQ